MNTAELLAHHAELLSRFGPDSPEVKSFLSGKDPDFLRLAEIARLLMIALKLPSLP